MDKHAARQEVCRELDEVWSRLYEALKAAVPLEEKELTGEISQIAVMVARVQRREEAKL